MILTVLVIVTFCDMSHVQFTFDTKVRGVHRLKPCERIDALTDFENELSCKLCTRHDVDLVLFLYIAQHVLLNDVQCG